ncbi:MAG TPA: cytochrome d ubiquinol oxidase subunit II [Bryobacteraceae bacterium]|jgi:cytochrome d ubiquinol oxidase subunit II|nr:cytochrome d ubiquinol oxidase subunit II [Bryobacteraceae bacterium]
MIQIVWFCLVAIMITGYVVLDGFDLGAGIIHLFVARTEPERQRVLHSIGPVWDGNEVWLIAGGGTLYFAFPRLYSAAFSGFYLALMMVLWLLILRGISIELRSHIESPIWKPFWDLVFGGSSALLALLYGAALGNVVRGVPFDSDGFFFIPLWTNFQPGLDPGIVDWYTLLIGAAAFTVLALHGCYWVVLKTDGDLQQRSRAFGQRIWWAVVAFTAIITVVSFRLQPNVMQEFSEHVWGYVFPLLAFAGLAGMRVSSVRELDLYAFLSSCAYLIGMLTSTVFGVFPYVLPSISSQAAGLTVMNAAAPEYGLYIGLAWWIPGMALALFYSVFVYRRFAGKVAG